MSAPSVVESTSPIYRGPLPHVTTVERVPVTVYEQPGEASRAVAREIADLVTSRAAAGKKTVLGLATGSTPVGVYDELIRLHKQEGVSFKTVVSFNLDEYWPIPPDALQSYHRFMREHLFDHVDIPAEAIHIPDGMLPRDGVVAACLRYEERIREAGGIDLQILGIGRTGHIGFNEPLSAMRSRTRCKALTPGTIAQNAPLFADPNRMPRRAMTMGVGTILESKRCLMLVTGEEKANILAKAVEGPITSMISATALQLHPKCTVIVDEAAGSKLEQGEYYHWIFENEPEWDAYRG